MKKIIAILVDFFKSPSDLEHEQELLHLFKVDQFTNQYLIKFEEWVQPRHFWVADKICFLEVTAPCHQGPNSLFCKITKEHFHIKPKYEYIDGLGGYTVAKIFSVPKDCDKESLYDFFGKLKIQKVDKVT